MSQSKDAAAQQTKSQSKKIGIAVAIVVVVIAVICAIVFGMKAQQASALDDAKAQCTQASEELRTDTNGYNALLNGAAKPYADLTKDDVKNPDALQKVQDLISQEVPQGVYCNVDTADELSANATTIHKNAQWYADQTKKLDAAIKDVQLVHPLSSDGE